MIRNDQAAFISDYERSNMAGRVVEGELVARKQGFRATAKRERPPSTYMLPGGTEEEDSGDESEVGSPSINRKPFKNLSNFMFPNVKKKISSSTKSFTRSVSRVTNASRFFNSGGQENEGLGELKLLSDEEEEGVEEPGHDEAHKGSPVQSRNVRGIRRIHSMCQTMKEKQNFCTEDNSSLRHSSIRTFKVDNDLMPRIDSDELNSILNGKYDKDFDKFTVVDCRFHYEYKGGHIPGAINISSQETLIDTFLGNAEKCQPKKELLIFHCEFSSCRGPKMASHLRRFDRKVNHNNYPMLSYPDIVILEGGYRTFYDRYKNQCVPQGYVEMNDANYQETCESEMEKVRQANKLTRAKSYNFAQDSRLSLNHGRSHSFTTVTSHAENMKVLKRQRSSSKWNDQFSNGSTSRLETRLTRAATFSYDHSVFNSPTKNSFVEDDLQPPLALFKFDHSKSNSFIKNHNSSLSSVSVSSFTSSICSDAAYSSDSLSDCYSSPVLEASQFFESTNSTNLMKNNQGFPQQSTNSISSQNQGTIHTRKFSGPFTHSHQRTANNNTSNNNSSSSSLVHPPNYAFKYPNIPNNKHISKRPSLSKVNVNKLNMSTPLMISSPNVSSPLATPATMDTMGSNDNTSILDPINDTPVDFVIPISTSNHQRSSSLTKKFADPTIFTSDDFNCKSTALNINEEDEEQDENERTLTDIKLID